jgi:hypothetical protein
VLLLWTLKKLGYDRRALICQTFFAIALLIVCRVFTAPPPEQSPSDVVNIIFVYGHGEYAQTQLPAWLYLTRMIFLYWSLMYLPIHTILFNTFDRRKHASKVLHSNSRWPFHLGRFRTSHGLQGPESAGVLAGQSRAKALVDPLSPGLG